MNDATYECIESVIDNFKNCYLKDEILLITPRDIKESVYDRSRISEWNRKNTNIEEAIDEVTKWLEDFRGKHSNTEWNDEKLTSFERRQLLISTIEKLREDYYKIPYVGEVHKGVLEFNVELSTKFLETIQNLSDNQTTRLLNIVRDMGYSITAEQNMYPFIYVFLMMIISLERYIHFEIEPNKEQLSFFSKGLLINEQPHDVFKEKDLIERLDFYRKVFSTRKKKAFNVSAISASWAIPFDDFAKFYRVLFNLQNTAVKTPFK